MSEEDRSRLYAWLREHADESLAEYLMSCLPAAPLSDLVTKDHLETVLAAEFSKFALALGVQREADRETYLAQSVRQFRWLIGTFIALTGVLIGAVYGAVAIA